MRVKFQPSGSVADVPPGTVLMSAAHKAGVAIESPCGAHGSCGKCRILVDGDAGPFTKAEKYWLTPEEIAEGYRLACQSVVNGDLVVRIPESSQVYNVSILSQGLTREVSLEPWVERVWLTVPPATLEHQISDLAALEQAWQREGYGELDGTITLMRHLPAALRAEDGFVSVVVADGKAIDVLTGSDPSPVLGLAFDVGTTTIVGYLMDLTTGHELAVSSSLNPQTQFGDDVVSRIEHITAVPDGLGELQGKVIGAINRIAEETCQEAGVSTGSIYGLSIVGNTTMQHLLLGVDPSALARSPYVPVVTDPVCLAASRLGIKVHPEAHVWAIASIAGWVGADTVGVILATGQHQADEISLAIDIGTNGEMTLGSGERLVACSTAAGPAFEGAHLSCGMRAAAGAIDQVSIDGQVHWRTIGNAPPRGICGSGLVDLVAAMLGSEILRDSGMMRKIEDLEELGQSYLAQRVRQDGRHRAFDLVLAEEGADGRPVRVTQRDVRELQLAKGAIRAGIEILLQELGITYEDVARVYLAGAFGNYIRPESALRIGLMPVFPNAEIVPVGNAAGSGAKLALLSRSARDETAQIVDLVEYLELSVLPEFQEHFAAAMIF